MSDNHRNRIVLDDFTEGVLSQARKTYGNKNQILVCMEELNELACALAKYPRYDDEHQATTELYDKVLDEVADVTIILRHVMEIFKITDEALDSRIVLKISRLLRWLVHSDSMQETVNDREIKIESPEDSDQPKSPCQGCVHYHIDTHTTYEEYAENCMPCYMAQATDGTTPNYQREE